MNNPRARQEILDNIIEDDDFYDIYRIFHDKKREYTWSRRNPVRKQARLDFFLVSFECLLFTEASKIIPGYRTDHSGIILELTLDHDIERGKGYWKFNNSLLKDNSYIKIVKETISEVKQTYLANDNGNNENTQQEEFNINDQLFLETLLLMIRGNTIKYSSFKKKQQQQEEIRLEREIKILEDEVNLNFNNMSEEKLNNLENKKTTLTDIQKEKIEGMMLRSRSRYEDLGEKPTKYFFNLEKRNYTSKIIHKLVNSDGEEFTKTADILKCQTDFYKDLYKQVNFEDNVSIHSVLGENENKLSDEESQDLEGEIKYSELGTALKNMKNNKSPGLDGFTVEFFKFFWIDIGHYILNSLNYGYRSGSLSVTQNKNKVLSRAFPSQINPE